MEQKVYKYVDTNDGWASVYVLVAAGSVEGAIEYIKAYAKTNGISWLGPVFHGTWEHNIELIEGLECHNDAGVISYDCHENDA